MSIISAGTPDCGYHYRPDSDLFVVLNDGPQFNSLAGGNPELARDRRLSIKWTYSILR